MGKALFAAVSIVHPNWLAIVLLSEYAMVVLHIYIYICYYFWYQKHRKINQKYFGMSFSHTLQTCISNDAKKTWIGRLIFLKQRKIVFFLIHHDLVMPASQLSSDPKMICVVNIGKGNTTRLYYGINFIRSWNVRIPEHKHQSGFQWFIS